MEIRPLHPEFGVEIRGGGLAGELAGDEVPLLRDALDRHQLLVLRFAEAITPEQQIRIASCFGPPVDNGGGQYWSELRNEEAAGSVKLPFHSDLSYTDFPLKVNTHYAVEVPPGGTTTSFISNVAGWASLPEAQRSLLAPMTVRHRHLSEIVSTWPEFVADHPVCKPHPRNRQPLLYVTEHHAIRILELEPAASEAMLASLFAHLYADELVYTHRWRAHDLLIWDNIATQHARREAAELSDGKRVVRRVVINDVTLAELTERARRQETARQNA